MGENNNNSDIQSRERLARLETSVLHIDNNLHQVIKNSQIQHDTLLKVTETLQQISETLSTFRDLETDVNNLKKDTEVMKSDIELCKKDGRNFRTIKIIMIGVALGFVIALTPASSLPTLALKLLGISL